MGYASHKRNVHLFRQLGYLLEALLMKLVILDRPVNLKPNRNCYRL